MILFGIVLLFMASYFSNKVYKIAAFERIAAILLPITVGSIVAGLFENSEISFGVVIGSNIIYLLVVTGINMMIDNEYKSDGNFIVNLNYGIIMMIIILFLSGDYLLQSSVKFNYISKYDGIIIILLNMIFTLYTGYGYIKENINKFIQKIKNVVKNDKKEILLVVLNIICNIIGTSVIVKSVIMYSGGIKIRQNIIGVCILPIVINIPNIISTIIFNIGEVKKEYKKEIQKDNNIKNISDKYIMACILSTLGLGISSIINNIHITIYNIYDLIYICVSYIIVWGLCKLRKIKTKSIGCIMVSIFLVYMINVCIR